MIHLTIIAILKVLSPNIVKFRSTREQDFNRGIWRENRTQSLLLLLLFSHQVMSNSTSFYVPHHSQSLPSSCPSNWWCHQLSYRLSVELFFCLQSFPASGSFQMSQLFASGGWNIGVSTSASILPMNIQGWVSLRLTGLISLLFKGLSKVFAASQFESISSSVPCLLYGPALASVHDYWKDHSTWNFAKRCLYFILDF